MFQLDCLQGEDLAPLIRLASEEPEKEEDIPEAEDKEVDKDPETYVPRSTKSPRAAAAGAEGSAKKTKTSQGGTQRRFDAKHREREHLKMRRTAVQGSQPTLPTSRYV